MCAKEFTLVHIVKNFPALVSEDSEEEVHFGVPWYLTVKKVNNCLAIYLQCLKTADKANQWSIDTSFKFILSPDQNTGKDLTYQFVRPTRWGWPNFQTWESVISNHLVNDCLTIECQVKIKKMIGFALKKKINFDESKESWTDGVLQVGEKAFNVNKRLLAFRSSYFDTLFFGPFDDSKKPEIELKGVDPDYFQNLLDIVYGESSMIQMENVEGVMTLADQFDVKYVRDKCAEFLSQKDDEEDIQIRFRLADKFNIEELKSKILQSITSADELKEVSPTDPSLLSHETLVTLYNKSLGFL